MITAVVIKIVRDLDDNFKETWRRYHHSKDTAKEQAHRLNGKLDFYGPEVFIWSEDITPQRQRN